MPGSPNILFMCSDQHIGSVLGASGHPIVRTPNFDRLAAMGMHFHNGYCTSPLCAPSRAGLMTGRYPSDVGSYCNATIFDGRVPAWSNLLQQAGYHCWATGKMDIKQGVDYGFEEEQTSFSHSDRPDIACMLRAPVCFLPTARERIDGSYIDKEHADVALVDRALAFLRNRAPKLGKPWAMYLGPHMPHPSWKIHRRYRDMYPPEKMPLPVIPDGYLESRHPSFQIQANYRNVVRPVPPEQVRNARAVYFAMVTELDRLMGLLLDELAGSGQLENTVIVYTSDHGEMLGEHGLWSKNVLLDNSARVPVILAGAGLPRRSSQTPVSHVDVVATMLELAGVAAPKGLRGRSLTGTLPEFAYAESHSDGNCTGSFMIRQDEWKYIYFTADRSLLFNLRKDPGELEDLAGRKEHDSVRRQLHARLTSVVDPDAVTERAFDEQSRRLAALVWRVGPKGFEEAALDRLGSAQTRALIAKLYTRRQA